MHINKRPSEFQTHYANSHQDYAFAGEKSKARQPFCTPSHTIQKMSYIQNTIPKGAGIQQAGRNGIVVCHGNVLCEIPLGHILENTNFKKDTKVRSACLLAQHAVM